MKIKVEFDGYRRIVLKLFLRIVEKKSCVVVPGLFVEKFVDFEKRVGGFCGDFVEISDNFEVIVIVNKTSFLVELDDCYCCAC